MSGTGAAPAAVPDQVLRHLTSVRALREGGHRTVLRLEPDHLGELTVTVDVRSGAVRMAVSGGAEALAAIRGGLGHLRTSLADSGLNLGDVALRPDAGGTSAAPAASTGPGADGRAPGSGPRPDAGAGSADGEPRPSRQHSSSDAPEAPLLDPGGGRVTGSAIPEPAGGPGARPGRLDVRV
ncbi:MAG: flagellar hook-length control protein FliK [Kineosporiaceae bacterium]